MTRSVSEPQALNLVTPSSAPAADDSRYAVRLFPLRTWLKRIETDQKHLEPIPKPLTPGPSPRKRGEGSMFWDGHLAGRLDQRHLARFLAWYRAYLEALAADPDGLFCGVVFRDDEVLLMVPLERTTRRVCGVRITGLQLPNHPRMVLGQPLVTAGEDPGGCVRALIAELRRIAGLDWDYLYLPNLLEDATTFAFASQADFVRTCDRVNGCCYCPVVPYEELPGRLSRSFRQAIRRNRKRLAQSPHVTFTTASTLADLREAYGRFLEVEASGWKGAQGTRTALKCDARFRAFYAQLLEHFGARGECEIHLMWLDNTPIAGQLTLTTDDTTYVLKIGYSQDYAHLSPGNMLFDYLFGRCAGKPAVRHVNLGTELPWMERWKPLRHAVLDVCLYRRSVRGRLAWGYWRLRLRARSLALAWGRRLLQVIRGQHGHLGRQSQAGSQCYMSLKARPTEQ